MTELPERVCYTNSGSKIPCEREVFDLQCMSYFQGKEMCALFSKQGAWTTEACRMTAICQSVSVARPSSHFASLLAPVRQSCTHVY